MLITDVLSDGYTRIRNGYKLNKEFVLILKSKKMIPVLDILYQEGFIRGYTLNIPEKNKIKVLLKYSIKGKSAINTIKNITSSSKRVYMDVLSLWQLNNKSNIGCYVLSTSKGVLSLRRALEYNVGGELLCYVD